MAQSTNKRKSTQGKKILGKSNKFYNKNNRSAKKILGKSNKFYNKNNRSAKKIYIGYNGRIAIYILMFITFILLGLMFTFKAFEFTEKKVINYSERSNLDYKVYLKENDFYDEDYLDKNMVYVASLIDKVKINFDYNFISDETVDLNFDYKVMAKLLITDSNGNNTYFKKDYVLLENKKVMFENPKNKLIKDSIEIDYDYYNSVANKFKSSYGVNAVSNLLVYVFINKETVNKNIVIDNDSLMSVTIPLSENSVNITIDYKEIDNNSKLIDECSIIIDNVIYMIIAIIFLLFSLLFVIKVVKLLTILKTNKNIYDRYIGRLLSEYDRLIVETTTCPKMDDDNIIKISKFQELLDVRDNLKLPIMYYSVAKHQKCYFYIMHENKFYLNIVKVVDLEKDNKQ